MNLSPSFLKVVTIILLVFNIFFIFVFVFSFPISWLHDELGCYRFYWSMDGFDQLTLHSGFQKIDFLKPLVSRFTDLEFRPRQVSNFAEMISCKFWQILGKGYFKDYTLIALHSFNILLCWLLIFVFTQSRGAAWCASLLIGGSGISLATLLFPFRFAKILIVTFFLLQWLLIATSKKKFVESEAARMFSFFALVFLSCLVDETVVFLLPVSALLIFLHDGTIAFRKRRLWRWGAGMFMLLSFSLFLAYHFSEGIVPGTKTWTKGYLSGMFLRWGDVQSFRDLSTSFIGYFLRRGWGFWEMSGWGITSFLAVVGIVSFLRKKDVPAKHVILAITLMGAIFLKAVLLPHVSVHKFIMPQGTVFPSQLFFSYYYPYLDQFLLIISLAFFMIHAALSKKRFLLLLGCVTLINISNVFHAGKNLTEALRFHGWDHPERKKTVENVVLVDEVLKIKAIAPVYLSFPAGKEPAVDGRFGFDAAWPLYPSLILTKYLRSFEEGRAILSLENARARQPWRHPFELQNADSFYDVHQRKLLDLSVIKGLYGIEKLMPHVAAGPQADSFELALKGSGKGVLVFFIKGASGFQMDIGDSSLKGQQSYGQAYQAFIIPVNYFETEVAIRLTLALYGQGPEDKAYVVGPFFLAR